MNSGVIIVFFVVVFLAAAFGLPPVEEVYTRVARPPGPEQPLQKFSPPEQDEEENLGLRFRRVTCDILSVSLPFGSLNHAACAAHCLAKRKGYKGGSCKGGVCHCRK